MRRAGWLLATLALVLLPCGPSFAQTNLCTAVANGATVDITGPGGPCKRITNSTGNTICAFTGDATRWTEFITKGMPNVTIANCPASCGGFSYGGYCYRLAATNSHSCDQVCASYGGCNVSGVVAAWNTLAVCGTIVTALIGHAPAAGNSDLASASTVGALGCTYYYFCYKGCNESAQRISDATPTCAAQTSSLWKRVCACAN